MKGPVCLLCLQKAPATQLMPGKRIKFRSLAYLCFIHILFFRQLLRDVVWHPSNGRHLHCGMLLMHFLVPPSLIQLAPELLQCPRP